MKVRSLTLNYLAPRRVRVVIDGTKVAEWSFSSNAIELLTFPVPPTAITPSGIVTVHFEMPDARRPVDLGISGETRLLGVGAASLRVMEGQ